MRSPSVDAALRALARLAPAWTDDTGWSAADPFELERYCNVPAEAFPFLRAHVDGCHYALWIDDPSIDLAPPVVWTSPMDGTPETLRLVAVDIDHFDTLVRRGGLWPGSSPDAERFAMEAARARSRHVVHPTKDGMGVVLTHDAPAARPADQEIASWHGPERSQLFARAVRAWLDAGAPGLALAVARDLIADYDALSTIGFADQLGAIYEALGRPHLAAVARAAYR